MSKQKITKKNVVFILFVMKLSETSSFHILFPSPSKANIYSHSLSSSLSNLELCFQLPSYPQLLHTSEIPQQTVKRFAIVDIFAKNLY